MGRGLGWALGAAAGPSPGTSTGRAVEQPHNESGPGWAGQHQVCQERSSRLPGASREWLRINHSPGFAAPELPWHGSWVSLALGTALLGGTGSWVSCGQQLKG